ncbi:MAG: tRNA uridine-5-carboxymethylaminomethyl(34) synthesis GTPase MnmE [Clostridia bacterium]|nr:tRNA uridine-5-carboxymethylaminomethyl(34) synthesis GTPase MnmE [Clostridia bacterium]
MKLLDTIAAISTPIGKGGVAMIRISGNDALSIGDKIFRRKGGQALSSAQATKMVYGQIIDTETGISVDDGMAVTFRAPCSFTGEDVVEIYCHGGLLVTRKVLSCVFVAGARPAEAGEFTRRAFLLGKLGLSEAEALGNLLEASNEMQMRLARGGMRGHLSAKTSEIYDNLRAIMAGIYAAIDFPDEDLNEYSREDISRTVRNAISEIDKLISTYSSGRAVAQGISTVICGKANAGKSSVYNRILGYDAAIVTDIKGTTRDVLREAASFGGVTLNLCDTAGLRQTDDTVESIGIERALTALEGAELALAVFDVSAPLEDEDGFLIDRLSEFGKVCIALLNKSDLGVCRQSEEYIRSHFDKCVEICADTGSGFDKLADTVGKTFFDGNIDIDNDAVVVGARQYASLTVAREALFESFELLQRDVPLDLCCVGIEAAMSEVAQVDGREIGEDIVSEIFSKFCVGK